MSAFHRPTSWLFTALLATAAPVAAQGAFPHEAHKGLFPLCQGCHDMSSGKASAHYPSPELCGHCHDGQLEPRVSWSPPASPGYPHPIHPRGTGVRPSCTDCHGTDATLVVDAGRPACEQCHARHHQAKSQCRLCHVPPPEAAHDASAHAGCSGSGCHAAARVKGLAFTRPLCLLCHSSRADHFAARQCVDCHPVGPGPAADGDAGRRR